MRVLLVAIAVGALAAGCATGEAPEGRAARPPAKPPEQRAEHAIVIGKASWYGEPHHGRKTASGEIYDMNAMTAAHRTLALGTHVRVTNVANGKSVVVRINDRGPFIDGRVIDLSKAAARELGSLGEGIITVRIEVLEETAAPSSGR